MIELMGIAGKLNVDERKRDGSRKTGRLLAWAIGSMELLLINMEEMIA